MLLLTTVFMPLSAFAVSYDEYVRDIKVDEATGTIMVYMDESLTRYEELTEKNIKKIYKKTSKDVHKALPKEYRRFEVRIFVNGSPLEGIEEVTPEVIVEQKEEVKKVKKKNTGWWGDVSYNGAPWTLNISKPTHPTAALTGKHISLWQSHGRYYDQEKATWKWQRPLLYSTTEDLFTQTIVVPYLIPMLENAGANVFTPRERDWQTEEVIVDNDNEASGYSEISSHDKWQTCSAHGFAMPQGNIMDGFNPFEQGTVRKVSTRKNNDASMAIYTPNIPRAGRYAVYVSYTTVENSVNDVLYTVMHKGMRTDFHVNQQMGGGTWVYLGTFDFDAGQSGQNRVIVSAKSDSKGVVTTDAIRFGGGMGNIIRGGTTSGLPRSLEGARYYAQWAGAPYKLYSGYNGTDDYKDDINVRSLMTNWLAGGSPFNPQAEGKHVPIDLALAIHSDAGYHADRTSIFGSLAVSTTDYNDGLLAAGPSRKHSADFALALLEQSRKDISKTYGFWDWRHLWDKNYSETRLPAMPSAIFETLSHESFPDMRLGQDPDFKFTLARSIYKTILNFEAAAHGEKAIVQPLAPKGFHIMLNKEGKASLSWAAQKDELEPSSDPTSYNIYMSVGGMGYDNGTNTTHSFYSIELTPDLLYKFRITAVNEGGESFPSEELCVVWHDKHAPTVLIINGFQRLSSPAIITDSISNRSTFDINTDPGLSYGVTAGWAGKNGELTGHFIAGNDFNYTAEHAQAIMSANRYNVISTTKSVVEWGGYNLTDYAVIDILMGNELNDGHSLRQYKTFSPALRNQIMEYQKKGRGAIMLSGSYIGTDMRDQDEREFLQKFFHFNHTGTIRDTNSMGIGLQQSFSITNALNPYHYATTQSDVLSPIGSAFVAMQYSDMQTAAVAYNSGFPTFTMGFPFECITDPAQRAAIMQGILAFLTQ